MVRYPPPSTFDEVYSTSEIAIGTWIDGKTVYQKTFVGYTDSSGAFPLISLSGVDTWIDQTGWIVRSDKYRYPLPAFYSVDDWIGVAINNVDDRLLFNPSPAVLPVLKNAYFCVNLKYTRKDKAAAASEANEVSYGTSSTSTTVG